jgi:hypothetical protein
MRTSAYHRSVRRDGGKRLESMESPWLEDKTTTPYRSMPIHVPAPTPPRAAGPRAMHTQRRSAPSPALQLRTAPVARTTPMTPDQLSHAALEAFWQDHERSLRHARTVRRTWLFVAAVLLAAVAAFCWSQPVHVDAPDLSRLMGWKGRDVVSTDAR